jgi:hypothetical protein
MWFAAALDGEIGRLATARPGFAYVLDIASGFVPAVRTVPLGTTVEWVLEAPGIHRVRDVTGLGLHDSGPQPPVSLHLFTFTAAGTYPYADPNAGERGVIAVPVNAPVSGQVGQAFRIDWATAAPGTGRVFDVVVRVPGSSTWQPWQTGVSTLGANYTPSAPGTYAFRGRLRGASGSSRWSPAGTVTVT